jgi:hypothetical protein
VRLSRRDCNAAKTNPQGFEISKRSRCCRAPLVLDVYRLTVETRKTRCRCSGYPFPHRARSLFCKHGAAGKVGLAYNGPGSQDDYYERFGGWK